MIDVTLLLLTVSLPIPSGSIFSLLTSKNFPWKSKIHCNWYEKK